MCFINLDCVQTRCYIILVQILVRNNRQFSSKVSRLCSGQPNYNLVGAGSQLLGKTWLDRKADLLTVSIAEFKKPGCYAPIFPIHHYEVHRNSRNVTSKTNIAITFVITFILQYYFIYMVYLKYLKSLDKQKSDVFISNNHNIS